MADTVLCAGTKLMCAPGSFIVLCALGMLSRAGRCRTFDGQADGYARGEGVGSLVGARRVLAAAAVERGVVPALAQVHTALLN